MKQFVEKRWRKFGANGAFLLKTRVYVMELEDLKAKT